ncbi:MAG TPA: heparin lyase I family protein [Beijerinckiaceae bacterium]|nr:heparin lyase I family protein [Beijerinckiaceae bacterium]
MRHILFFGLGLAAAASAASANSLRDNFDKRALDLKNWSAAQINPSQIGFEQPGRCGGAAIRITVKAKDGGSSCDSCQRAEVRVNQQFQPKYGDEMWYAFSFRVSGDVPRDGASRNVIAQFKAPGDDSPFLAQRIDNGVFQITMEDSGVRRVIAKSEGDPESLGKAQNLLSGYDPSDARGRMVMRNLQAVHRIARTTPDIAGLLFTHDAQSGLRMPAGKDFTSANGAKMSSLFGMEGEDAAVAMREMVAVNDIDRYLGRADITVAPGPGAVLPNPFDGWVDMVYRIKGGRTDNTAGPNHQGEVDIWANGRLVANVRGNFGNKLTATPADTAMYFKFGIYRDARPFEQKVLFDEYAQGTSRSDVTLACAK